MCLLRSNIKETGRKEKRRIAPKRKENCYGYDRF
jgi:hypothetical protein